MDIYQITIVCHIHFAEYFYIEYVSMYNCLDVQLLTLRLAHRSVIHTVVCTTFYAGFPACRSRPYVPVA